MNNNYSEILSIAQQCPYAGGPAVERARTFVAMINDTLSYDDDNVCLISGIFRHTNTDSISNMKETENKIIVKPNPANDKIEISLRGKFEGMCKIEIRNTLGEIVLLEEMNCKEVKRIIDISKITQGAYSIKVDVNNSTFLNTKLVIVR